MKLVLAEKPSVAMDLGKGLGNIERHNGYLKSGDYYITWAVGHLAEINEEIAPKQWKIDTLPILPETFTYKVTEDKVNQFNIIKNLLKKAECVVIATDAGREGELIARLILELAEYKGKIQRFWTSEALSPDAVKKEFTKLKDGHDFDSLYYSALGRQHSDWLFGINLTRLATIKATDKSIWSIGRVQTPILKIIVERELEIRNFKPKPYWVIKSEFSKDGKKYIGTLLNKDEKNSTSFFDKEKAEKILEQIKEQKQGIVSKVTKEAKKQKAPLLHSLTTLQREANQIYAYSAKQTLDLAQELYEAKKISYPRTDAQHLDEQKDTKELVKKVLTKLGKENLLDKIDKVGKSVFNTKKLTDHYAIIPQDILSKKQLNDKLTEEHYNIYVLIARRLTGAFMPDYLYETTTINTKVGEHNFISRGKIDKQLGWKELYKKDKNIDENQEEDQSLPNLSKDDIVDKNSDFIEKKETKPPEKYKESSILAVMERLNLGTPATRASIIETLKSREYIVLEKKNLIPKPKGIQLIQSLKDREFTDPEMTASWEHQLDNIYKGKQGFQGYSEFLNKMKEVVSLEIDGLKNLDLKEMRVIEKCEKCKDILEFEKFFKCNKCESIVWREFIGKTLTEKNVKDLFNSKEISLKDLVSKQGKKFDANAKIINGKLELIFNNENLNGEIIGKCSCDGDIYELTKLYKCVKCEKIIWKKFLEKDISKEEAIDLLNNKTIELKGLKSKAGKVFDAKAKFQDNKIQLDFG
ncbi:MAG: DNA topoisomerase [Candidatus Sericytochromatia bacterium]